MTVANGRPSLAPYPTYPLQHILSATAQRVPQKTAIIDGEYVYSYQQLDMYSNRFAAALAKLGVEKGDRVGLLAPNCVEFEIAFFGGHQGRGSSNDNQLRLSRARNRPSARQQRRGSSGGT